MRPAKRPYDPALKAERKLAQALRLTRWAMVCERAARAFWPAWSILLAALSFLMIGLHDLAPLDLVRILGAVAGGGALWAIVRGARAFRWPSAAEARARLDDTMQGQPLAALADTQAIGTGDPASRAVWKAHRQRMARAVRAVRPVRPDLRLSRFDPFALRHAAALALAVALLFGSPWRAATIVQAVPGRGAQAAAGPSWEGWIDPPLHTGLPGLYLNDLAGERIDVPEGSLITLRLYGQAGALGVREDVSGLPPPSGEGETPRLEFEAAQSGTLAVEGDAGAAWDITVIPDRPPEVALTGEMDVSVSGEMRQEFSARDDYGVETGRAVIRLDLEEVDRRHGLAEEPDPRDPVILDLPMTITGDRDDFSETLVDNLSRHPWAGLPVTMTLEVADAAGNTGTTPVLALSLPGRRFFEPMARAVIEMRRDLLWSRSNGARVAQILRAVSHRPEDNFDDASVYLMLRTAIRRLEAGMEGGLEPEAQGEIAEALWQIAVQIEDGDIGDALERLQRAQERLRQAMREGATESEIEELMNELREATRDYMRQLARDPENTTDQPDRGERRMLSQQDIQDMMDRIQDLMEQGRMAEAEQLMQQFQQMMENLRMTDQGGEGGQSEGQQAMEGLTDTLRQQQGLSDEAFRSLQEQFNPGAQAGQSGRNQGRSGGEGRGESHEGQGGEGQGRDEGRQGGGGRAAGQQDGDARGLADRQQALREELRRQQQGLPGAGTPEGDAARDALDRAGRAMDGAEEALREDDLAGALDNQAEAMEALRDGLRQLSDALARNQQNQGQQGQAGGRAQSDMRDPLGRTPGAQGPAGTDEGMLQGEDVYRRARELLDELRKRSSDQDRPKIELEYLKRLLDRF